MNRIISVYLQLTSNEFFSIPVRYSIEKESDIVTIYTCNVESQNDKISEWLIPDKFKIRCVSRNSIASLSIEKHGSWQSVDSVLFAEATMQQIRLKEAYFS